MFEFIGCANIMLCMRDRFTCYTSSIELNLNKMKIKELIYIASMVISVLHVKVHMNTNSAFTQNSRTDLFTKNIRCYYLADVQRCFPYHILLSSFRECSLFVDVLMRNRLYRRERFLLEIGSQFIAVYFFLSTVGARACACLRIKA